MDVLLQKEKFPSDDTILGEQESIQEISGSLKNTFEEGLMKTVLENDAKAIEKGKVIGDAINQGISSFSPDIMFEKLVRNYREAEQIYGKKLIRQVTGYDASYIERNIHIPEFVRELKKKIEEGIDKLEGSGILDREGGISQKGYDIAALTMYVEELDHILSSGVGGEYEHKKVVVYGERADVRSFRPRDRYKDIALKASLKTALRRGHDTIEVTDLRTFERVAKGGVQIVYAMDSSGSMRGKKMEQSKRAGVALAFTALENKDRVGLLVFSDRVNSVLPVGSHFGEFLRSITNVTPGRETNMTEVLREAEKSFLDEDGTKHLIVLSDALPTVGKDPKKEVLAMIATLRNAGITTSIVAIGIEKKEEEFAREASDLGGGWLSVVRDVGELDHIILEDYWRARAL